MHDSTMLCFLDAFHALLRSTASPTLKKSMAATHSGWCHSVALGRSCWNVMRWSVMELPSLKLAWSADWLWRGL